MRRIVGWALFWAGFIFICFLSGAWAALSPMDLEGLRKSLEKEIKAEGVEVGLALKDLETGESLFLNEKTKMHAASTMKVAVMVEVFKQAAEGKFSLDDALVIKNEFRSVADGSLYSLTAADDSDPELYSFVGQKMAIRELVERMITVSSNLATNILMDLARAQNVMATLAAMGVSGMEVLRGVEDARAFEKGLNNQTDALALMHLLEAIATGRAVSEASSAEMMAILTRQRFRAGIPAGVPEAVLVGNKTGSISGIEHDAAIVFPPGCKPYILVILTRGARCSEVGEKLIARLSAIVYQALEKKGDRKVDLARLFRYSAV